MGVEKLSLGRTLAGMSAVEAQAHASIQFLPNRRTTSPAAMWNPSQATNPVRGGLNQRAPTWYVVLRIRQPIALGPFVFVWKPLALAGSSLAAWRWGAVVLLSWRWRRGNFTL